MKYIIILRGTNALDKTEKEFFTNSGRLFCAIDSNSNPIIFDDEEVALNYLIENFSIYKARVAPIPQIEGDSEEGYILERE